MTVTRTSDNREFQSATVAEADKKFEQLAQLEITIKAKKAIKNGDDLIASYNRHKAWVRKVDPGFWSPMDLSQAIEGTINHLDEAACQKDMVIDPTLAFIAGRPVSTRMSALISSNGVARKWISYSSLQALSSFNQDIGNSIFLYKL